MANPHEGQRQGELSDSLLLQPPLNLGQGLMDRLGTPERGGVSTQKITIWTKTHALIKFCDDAYIV